MLTDYDFYQMLLNALATNQKTSWGKNELALYIRDVYIQYLAKVGQEIK